MTKPGTKPGDSHPLFTGALLCCVVCVVLLAIALPAAAESYGPAFDESPTPPLLPTPFSFNAAVYVIHVLAFLGFLGWCVRDLLLEKGKPERPLP